MSNLERIDYGTSYKYFPNPSLALGKPIRRPEPAGKQEFSLLNLNPHRSSLGLQAEDFTPSKLCASISSAIAEADHQLQDSKTPAVSAAGKLTAAAEEEDEDEDAGVNNAQDSAAAAAAAEGTSEKTVAAAAAEGTSEKTVAAAAATGPDIQFMMGDSSSGSESDEEASSESRDEDGDHDQRVHHQQQPKQHPEASGDEQALDHMEAAAAGTSLKQEQQQDETHRRKRPRVTEDDDDKQQQQQQGTGDGGDGHSSDCGSSSGSESDTEGEDEELQTASDDQVAAADGESSESQDNFLPLLPNLRGGVADDQSDDHDDDHDLNSEDPAAGDRSAPDRTPGYKPPWLPRLARFSSPMLRLHNEIVAFTKMLEPTPEEIDSRSKSMRVIREVVNSIWPHAEVLVFGSYETGLYTPASDTDVVVVNAGLNNPQTGLKALAHALTQRQLVRNMQQVLTARVPIIKFEMIESGLQFDVAWEQRSGPQGAKVVRNLLAQWPVMKPLVLVLKVFLTQRELNEVYSGGIGSYSLIIMVAAFLQLHTSRRPKTSSAGIGSKRGRGSSIGGVPVARNIEANLGLLLLDFFRLYGRALNLSEVGVSCSSEGYFYSKASKGFVVHDRPWLLSVQDPLDPTNDTARNSWNIKLVRQVFDHAYQLLTAPCSLSESLLGRIIHLAPVVSGRPIPAWFHETPKTPIGYSHRHRSKTPTAAGGSSSRKERSKNSRRDHPDDRDRHRKRSRSRPDGSSSSSKRRKSAGGDGGRKQKDRGDYQGGGGGGSSKKQQGRSRRGNGNDNDFAAAGQAELRLDRGRDAAGRAAAAAGDGGRYQQQQWQSRKKQRRR